MKTLPFLNDYELEEPEANEEDSQDIILETDSFSPSFDLVEKAKWSECQSKLLIALYNEYEPKIGSTLQLKSKKQMWQIIQSKMARQGHNFTPTQIESKWKNMNREPNMLDKATWVDTQTKLLIALYKEYEPKIGKSLELRTKKQMWETIQAEMAREGHNFAATQIENKWKSLERTLRNCDHHQKIGKGRQTFPYEKDLADVLTNKNEFFPTFRCGSRKRRANLDASLTNEKISNGNHNSETNTSSQMADTIISDGKKLKLSTLNDDEENMNSEETNLLDKAAWVDCQTKLLLDLYKEYKPKVGQTAQLRTKRKMWKLIQSKMSKEGHNFTLTQIQNKWKSLDRTFKNCDQRRTSGIGKQTCTYEKELTDIAADNENEIFPKFLLGSPKSLVSLEEDDTFSSDIISNESDSDTSSCSEIADTIRSSVKHNKDDISEKLTQLLQLQLEKIQRADKLEAAKAEREMARERREAARAKREAAKLAAYNARTAILEKLFLMSTSTRRLKRR